MFVFGTCVLCQDKIRARSTELVDVCFMCGIVHTCGVLYVCVHVNAKTTGTHVDDVHEDNKTG